MHNTIDERIAETDLFCGNFCIETKILNLIGCVLSLTTTDATDITRTNQVQERSWKNNCSTGGLNPQPH